VTAELDGETISGHSRVISICPLYKSGHIQRRNRCLLSAISGHRSLESVEHQRLIEREGDDVVAEGGFRLRPCPVRMGHADCQHANQTAGQFQLLVSFN
jgi:hypothetical protein